MPTYNINVKHAFNFNSRTHYAKGTFYFKNCFTIQFHFFSLDPFKNFFSPFPRGTRSLSVRIYIIDFEDGSPIYFHQYHTIDVLF
jgi:hypothetical protein